MRETLITRKDTIGASVFDSIAWAFAVHVARPDIKELNAAVVYGDADCPSMIDFYREAEPLDTSEVAYRWIALKTD